MSKSKKLIKQTAWYSLFSNSKTLLQFFSSIVLARLLTPEDFGLVAMVSVIIGFSSLFLDLGMATAYVQKKEVDESHRSGLFLQSSISGGVLALLVFSSKALIVNFYENAALEPIILWMAIDLSITALYATPTAMLRRESRFKTLGLISLWAFFLSFVVTVFFALLDCGAMSIVYGVVFKDVFMLLAVSFSARWCPSFRWDRAVFVDMLKVGGWLSLTRILGFIGRQIDTLLVGRYFGAAMLGVYNRAYAFMLLPLQKVGSVVSETTLPTLRDYQEENEKLYVRIEKILVSQLIFLIPLSMFFWAERYFIINLVYGEKWNDVAVFLTYLLPVALLDISRSSLLQIFVIKGKTKTQFYLSFLSTVVVVSSIVIGVLSKKIIYLVIFYAVSKIMIWAPVSIFTMKYLCVDPKRFFVACFSCLNVYWPLYFIVIVNLCVSYLYSNINYKYLQFFIFFVTYGATTLICIAMMSKKLRYKYIFESFPFLLFPSRVLGFKNR